MSITLSLLVGFGLGAAVPTEANDPQKSVTALLAADRAFSAAAKRTDPATALAAMFDDDIVLPAGPRGMVTGREAASTALRDNPANRTGRLSWTPVRAGISADGSHGFTIGYAVTNAVDGAKKGQRYLAYWVKRPVGWRVLAYRRTPQAEGEAQVGSLAPSLPAAAAPADRVDLEAGLRTAEQAFSDDAQTIGLHAAFDRYGADDAIHVAHRERLAVGKAAVLTSFDAKEGPSPVRWSADGAAVAPSGDLGITWGIIRSNKPVAGQPSEFPFFTIWRRAGPTAPWRYVAE